MPVVWGRPLTTRAAIAGRGGARSRAGRVYGNIAVTKGARNPQAQLLIETSPSLNNLHLLTTSRQVSPALADSQGVVGVARGGYILTKVAIFNYNISEKRGF